MKKDLKRPFFIVYIFRCCYNLLCIVGEEMKRINKNGFTLIEMLAVVVLLGLLIAFLFPAITKYITETKENTYLIYEQNTETKKDKK